MGMSELITRKIVANEEDLNRDPITGTPGAHPLGTGAGAVVGGLSGAALGTAAGPLGAVIGAAAGAVMGGLVGKSSAEAVNPTAEEVFWRETYVREPYYVQGRAYEYYAPGFRAGWKGRVRNDGRTYEEAEPELLAEYILTKSELDPDWQEIRPAARAAWDRVDHNRNANR
jgi:hypothetical protein